MGPDKKTARTHEFNLPSDVAQKAAPKAAVVAPSALIGTWNNCDAATRGLLRVVIAASGSAITVRAFGACTPTPCDWGTVPGLAYAADVSSSSAVAFTAHYKFSFKETIVTGVLDQRTLIVETFNRFTDGSGRSNYYSKAYLCHKGR
jgi:hypothetical protein